MAAITSGGAIPDTANYVVIAEPDGTVVGSVDEDFAVESLAGDIMLLGKLSHSTVEAWRKRGTGPAYILLGNRYLYPRQAVQKYLEGITRERNSVAAKEAL